MRGILAAFCLTLLLDCGPALGGFEDLVGNCSTWAALINAREFCNQVAYAAYPFRIQIPK